MSKIEPIKIKCPMCRKRFVSDFYASINVSINPQLKERVLNGEINTKICPKCDSPVKIKHPILYHDMHKKILLWVYYPNDNDLNRFSDTEKENARKIMLVEEEKELKLTGIDYIFQDYRKDVVLGESDLKEKLEELER